MPTVRGVYVDLKVGGGQARMVEVRADRRAGAQITSTVRAGVAGSSSVTSLGAERGPTVRRTSPGDPSS